MAVHDNREEKHMSITGKNDPILMAQLRNAMMEDAKRRAFTPRPRIRRPWLGDLNWANHKRKMADKRRAHNRMARQSRKAQRCAARA